MKPRELMLLAALSRTGSVTGTAQSMGMSQPAASAMLRKMEEELGFALFTRKRRRLELTPNGRALLPGVVHALAALESVERLAQGLGHVGYRRLLVGAVPVVGASILPPAVATLQRERPELSVSLINGTALEITDMVVDQRLDLGVIFGATSSEHVGSRSVALLDLYCLMRPEHPYAWHQEVSVDELAAVPYIAHSRRLPLGALTAHALEQHGHRFEPVVEVNQFSAACAFTEAGCGITVVEALTALYAERLGLVARPFQHPSDLSLTVIWPVAAGLSSYAVAIVDALKSSQDLRPDLRTMRRS